MTKRSPYLLYSNQLNENTITITIQDSQFPQRSAENWRCSFSLRAIIIFPTSRASEVASFILCARHFSHSLTRNNFSLPEVYAELDEVFGPVSPWPHSHRPPCLILFFLILSFPGSLW